MTDLLQDMRFGFRTFKRRPAFTLSALLILIVGIGSSTAIFSVVNQVLLAPLPYRAPQRLVRIFGTWDRGAREGISPPDFEDYRRRSRLLQSVAAAGNSTPLVSLKAGGEPEQIPSRNVTSGFFSTLGITPLFGREFLPEEEAWRGPRVAILSFGLWRRQFGADTTIVGRSFSINGVPYTAVGVLPPFFNFIGAADLFTPLQSNPVPEMRGIRTLTVIGRLRDRIDVNQAQNELDAVSRGLQEENARFDRGWSVTLAPLAEEVVKDVKPALLALLAAVGLLVLLVAANVASLVLAEAATRRGEICLRLSLGASQARVVRQLLTESVMLALAGGAGGCVVARWMLGLLKRFGPATIPRLAEVTLDLRVLAFALIVSTLVGILCGLEPAWRTHRQDLAESMKGARVFSQHVGVRDALVVLEVTVSVILLIGAGLLIQSVLRLERVNPGFDANRVLTTRLALPAAKYRDGTGEKLNVFWRDAVQRVESIPGVRAAALTSELPLGGLNNPSPRLATTAAGDSYLLDLRSVSPNYATVMQIPLRAGRFFTAEDRLATRRVAVISEQFRKDVFGDRNPIGERLTFNFQNRAEKDDYQVVVVGVIGSVRHVSLAVSPFREVYLPIEQSPLPDYDLVVRTRVEPARLSTQVRQTLRSMDPDQAIGGVRTLDDVLSLGLAQPKFRGYLLGMFAVFAVLLAAAGLYGLLSFSVTQRTREIGIRMAIGATSSTIVRLIVVKAMALTGAGVAVGLVASVWVVRMLSTLVFGVGLMDPATFAAGTAILAAVALTASYFPARRAMMLDPVEALRSE